MPKVRVRAETGTLYLDFTYRGVRCREQTALPDSAGNRQKVERLLARVQREIQQGVFDYTTTFPGSAKASQFAEPVSAASATDLTTSSPATDTPEFGEFARLWIAESEPQ